jgi:hypothetical protein
MKRFSIIVRERGSDRETELCQCDNNPDMLVTAAQMKRMLINEDGNGRKIYTSKYEHVYFRENSAASNP